MNELNNIDIKFSTKHLPLEYKLLEFRLIINKDLYDEGVINFQVFKAMEESLLSRLAKAKKEKCDFNV